MKKAARTIAKILLIFIGCIAAYFLTAFCLSRITVNPNPTNPKEIAIYIMTNGVHTDIVVPAANEIMDWRKEILFSDTKSANPYANFLAFGWGDRKFYLETPEFSDLKFSTAVQAVFGLGKSAVHTTYYTNIVEDKQCKKIQISKNQYIKLVKYLSASFNRDENGQVKNIETTLNYDNSDAFYEGVGSYSLFKTCNTWANDALKSCDQRCCAWTIFDTAIFLKYK